MFEIKEVIFNDPATIVYWMDGTKTIVHCGENDTYDKEKGLAMCFMKKACGNKSKHNYVVQKALEGKFSAPKTKKKVEDKPMCVGVYYQGKKVNSIEEFLDMLFS